MNEEYPQFISKPYWVQLIEPRAVLMPIMDIDSADSVEEAIKNVKEITVQEYVIRKRRVIIRVVEGKSLWVLFMVIVNCDTVEYFDYRDEKNNHERH